MNVIKNEKGTFVELPRESITFCGNTEEEKKANELIFDLSLENDGLQQELERYKNIISKIETLVINHNCDTGDIYYKYNGKYLKSELKDRILELLELKGE